MARATALLAATIGSADAVALQSGADLLIGARSWGYQLQNVDTARLERSDCDVLVIDFARDGLASSAFSALEIAKLKAREGRPRAVLAYLSIGEAEDYRSYWQPSWRTVPPRWLKSESLLWRGNFPVRFWDPEWRRILYGEPGAYLDLILQSDFDGIYLDRVDAFAEADAALSEEARMKAMRELVVALARYGRIRKPGFLVVPQNGEELLADTQYRAVIDGFAKEDLFYGLEHDEAFNSAVDITTSLALVNLIKTDGKPLFLVEYLSRPEAVADARGRAEAIGGLLFIGGRELDDAPAC